MRKLLSLLAKMSQDNRNLILFLAGRVSPVLGSMQIYSFRPLFDTVCPQFFLLFSLISPP